MRRYLNTLHHLIVQRPYLLVSSLIVLGMLPYAYQNHWQGDFWEHSAVVRELATHPLHPKHPVMNVEVPHAFFSPYLLCVGVFSRISGMSPVHSLAAAGIFNLALLLWGFFLFFKSVTREIKSVYAAMGLLCLLLLWPGESWRFSGFFHFDVLYAVAPYPSTVAMALTFFSVAIFSHALRDEKYGLLAIAAVMTGATIITHPTTAIYIYITTGAITLDVSRLRKPSPMLWAIAFVAVSILLAFAWPYYSVIGLFQANDPQFHSESFTFYRDLWHYAWPMIVLTPFSVYVFSKRLRKNVFDPFSVTFLLSLVVYLLAFSAGQYGMGRIIAFLLLLMQLAVGMQSGQWLANKGWIEKAPVYLVIAAISVALAYHNAPRVFQAMKKGIKGKQVTYKNYDIFKTHTEQYDTIMADLEAGWCIPTFGGKVIAEKHIAHWVTDHDKRRADIDAFYTGGTSANERQAILARYSVDYFIIGKNRWPLIEEFLPFGTEIVRNREFVLMKTKGQNQTHHSAN